MTRVLFEHGRLRLAPEIADAWVAWTRGEAVAPDAWRALTDADVVRGNQPHPDLAPGVAAMTAPLAMLVLRITAPDDGSDMNGAGWLGEESAALLLDTPDDLLELACVTPAFVPAALARVLDISPRSTSSGDSVRLPEALLAEFLDPDPLRRSRAREQAPHAAKVLTTTGVQHWDLSVWGPEHNATLRIIDTGNEFWLVDHDSAAHVTLRPVSPTDVWRRLLDRFPNLS